MTQTERVTNLLLQQTAFSRSSKRLRYYIILTGELLSYLVLSINEQLFVLSFLLIYILLSTALDSAT